VIFDTACSVAAPLLISFTLWTLIEARRLGLKKLHFLARDGQILARVATLLSQWLDSGIEIGYLLASRRALAMAALDLDDPFCTEVLARMSSRRSLAQLAVTLDVSADSLLALIDPNSTTLTPGSVVTDNVLHLLLESLATSPIGSAIRTSAREQREAALSYLESQGVCATSKVGIVDIGWMGNLQYFLFQLLRHSRAEKPTIHGLYFGLHARPPDSSGATRTYVETPYPFHEELLELFCAADHGSVKAFRRSPTGEATIELQSAADENAIRWGVATQQEAIVSYTRNILQKLPRAQVDPLELQAFLGTWAKASFVHFHRAPSRQEAEVYGAFLHASDLNHSVHQQVAPITDMLSAIRPWTSKQKETLWPQATLIRSANRIGAAAAAEWLLRANLTRTKARFL
jgi:hypothetical protein